MKNKILTANLCLFLLFGGVITTSTDIGGEGKEESMFLETSLEEEKDLKYEEILDEIPVLAERRKNNPTYRIDSNRFNNSIEEEEEENSTSCSVQNFLGWAGSNIQDFLGWAGSNIQDFLGWAGSNIQDFFGWAGSNSYSALAALGRGTIILLLVLLLIVIVYGAIMI